MELRQLRYFAKAAETLNFSDAAKALNIAQSSLSQQIKQLEDELNVQLFLRNSHSIRLTEAGEEMLPFALRTIHDAETCADRIHDLQKLLTGTLNIGITYSFSPILTETVISFMKMYPHIKLNIIYKPMSELMELLAKRDLDFVLAFKPTKPVADVESHILFQNSLSAIVSSTHPLASKDKVTLAELGKYELALPSKGLQARNAFDSLVTTYNDFQIRIELNEVNILLKLIRQTHLVTVLAEDSIYNECDVKAVPLDVPDNEMIGCVHILKDTYHKHSMKEFIRLLSESLIVKKRQNSWI
ncbi:LysR substrate-binding domain-containing protein [uncultured Bacteroides sp.]|uniref:LysR substrate-binding domain-containing protein n=1 Tax=uncultured Bacteroides sp. TaxID=162156 RepID=UPI0023CE74B7|nr:LysR substrate-binding domain-containing protein [uncultured Bacteroides sp.]MDE6172956.1 LysR family transcriptional regulator [Bacteroides sp.]